ncbi:hypothetical protein C8R46DRAFT_1300343, partial [Mycena filopes]
EYDKFYDFAKKQRCLIDDYDKVHRDFQPFYRLAERNPNFFPEMLAQGMRMAADDPALCLSPLTIRHHKGFRSPHPAPFEGDWAKLLEILGPLLPDIDLLFNYQDEPRVLFNLRRPDAYEFALKRSDPDPFRQGPRPTKEYYEEATPHQCLLPNSDTGFGNPTNNFYYDRSWFGTHTSFKDNVAWGKKKSMIYWRGHTSGGAIDGQNYHAFPQFRIIDIARQRPDIMDAALTGLHNCNTDPDNAGHAFCPEDEIKAGYDVDTPPQPREAVYKYNDVPMQSTIISEFFDDWLLPYVHYIPVLPDLSDLEAKVEWAIENDAEARQIQANGLEFATHVITDNQMDCYHLAVFLEYARLQKGM